jgi:3-methyladenine DNA glycosylase AlkC
MDGNSICPTIISEDILMRKGARKAVDIPDHIRTLLKNGLIESVNLTEWLSVDHFRLFQQVVDTWNLDHEAENSIMYLQQMEEQRIMKIIPAIASQWLKILNTINPHERLSVFHGLSAHASDSVRCWAAYVVGLDPNLNLADKLGQIRPFAADKHFGVREIAWMALREPITADLSDALQLLAPWVTDVDPYIRRFAIEATRPQGVWAKHIHYLKEHPEDAVSLLDAVKSDEVKYVQNSVANWLNDASKTNPDWVRQVCDDWLRQSDTKHTRRIAARAQRNL